MRFSSLFWSVRSPACTIVAAALLAGCTSMQKAAQSGDVQTVIKGLAAGKDVNMADANGRPLIAIAAERGQLVIIRELIGRGADLEKKDGLGMTPLYIAAGSNQLPAVQELVVAKAAIESRNTDLGMTPLMPAAESGYKAVVEYLLSRGAKADVRSSDNQTALSRLARVNARTSQSDSVGTAELLLGKLRAGASKKALPDYVNQQDRSGFTALHRAAGNANSELIAFLLQNGANPNIAATLSEGNEKAAIAPEVSAFAKQAANASSGLNALLPMLQQTLAAGRPAPRVEADVVTPAPVQAEITRWTPLLSAAQHCQAAESSIKALLAAGANPLARASNNRTALQILAECEQGDPAPALKLVLERAKTKSSATDFRQFINEQDGASGRSALLSAVTRSHAESTRLLLAAGASPNVAGKDGVAPLHVALAAGSNEVARHLLAAKANPNQANGAGIEPLYWMVSNRNADAVKLLLSAGARPNAAAPDGFMPLHKAAANGDVAIINALLAAKANPDAVLEGVDAPLHIALAKGDTTAATALLSAGANPNLKKRDGTSPLYNAVSQNNVEIARLLLTKGAKPDLTFNGTSPLYMAVQNNNLPIVQLLLNAKANPDVSLPEHKWTPLHKAAYDGNAAAYQLLLASGADSALRNRENKTAADLVREREARLLREAQERAEAERQRQLQAQQAEQNSFQWGKLAALAVGAAAGGLGELDSATQSNVIMGMVQDSMAGQQSLSHTQAAAQSASSSMQSGASSSAMSQGASGTPQSWIPEPNTLNGSAACSGYTDTNYKEFYGANSNGPDVQLHTLCAAAYNYYSMYLNAKKQGYSKEGARPTYDAFLATAKTVEDFYANTRTR